MTKTVFILLSALLPGCILGPNFHRPQAPNTKGYSKTPYKKSTTTGVSQHVKLGAEIPKKWWTVFHSKPLNRLIEASIKGNPDLVAASAALKIAHENTLIQQTAYFPMVGANYNPNRQLTAGTLSSNLMSNAYLYTLNTTNLSITYMPDVLGLTRRQVESMRAMEESACFQREAVYLTLASNVVITAIQEAMVRRQIEVTKRNIVLASDLYNSMRHEQLLGEVGEDSVAAQAAILAQTKAFLPPLEIQLAAARHLLLSLQGQFPSDVMKEEFTLDMFTLPKELPLSLPSKLVNQRPDIRAAEAMMHAASAQIGVAIANRLPNVLLSANGGFMPANFSSKSIPTDLPALPLGSSLFWGIGANIAGTVFDAGALLYQQRAAVAAYKLAEAQYKRVVLNAFEEVADTLKAIEADGVALKIAMDFTTASKKSLLISKHKWKLGQAGYLEVLNAEQIHQQARMALAQSKANRFTDTVALFQALGGGWWKYRV